MALKFCGLMRWETLNSVARNRMKHAFIDESLSKRNFNVILNIIIIINYGNTMPVARQRHTKARRDRARVFHQIKPKRMVKCTKCKSLILSHTVCPNCGFYKEKEVIDTMKKVDRKNKNKK